MKNNNKFNQNSVINHRKNYSYAESNNTIDFIKYPYTSEKILNLYTKKN